MTQTSRPRGPAPEFPPRRAPIFATLPPAVFPPLLGLFGLGLALRAGLGALELDRGFADILLGMVLAVYLFAGVGYKIKYFRRPAVLVEDLRILPGRVGLATSTMAAMVASAAMVPVSAPLAMLLLVAALIGHAMMALILIATLIKLPPEAREVNPAWHLSFVGFIVGGIAAADLGWTMLAQGLLIVTLPVALGIWAVSLVQLVKRVPPAPLRPLLAIHLAPASLFAIVATKLGLGSVALIALAVAVLIFVALLASLRWITETGFSPMWSAFTFPLTAFASALMAQGGAVQQAGLVVLAVALVAVPMIAWRVLKLWPTGALAAKTNAAKA